jgi:hypothetical protein
MGFWSAILKTKKSISERIEAAIGFGSAKTVMAVRQGILDRIESGIVTNPNGRRFPFGKVIVRLQPQAEAHRVSFEKAFLHKEALKADILQKLSGSQTLCSDEFEAIIEMRPGLDSDRPKSPPRPLFEVDFVRHDPARRQEIPETKLSVTRGTAERMEYLLKKERILIGSLSEVLDREGRMVRKNDVVFPGSEGELNSSVGYAHARIWFDFEKGEFCLLDEVSRYGTRIVRDGLTIEVPGGDTNGIRLQSGDDIYFGQACLRFELMKS